MMMMKKMMMVMVMKIMIMSDSLALNNLKSNLKSISKSLKTSENQRKSGLKRVNVNWFSRFQSDLRKV